MYRITDIEIRPDYVTICVIYSPEIWVKFMWFVDAVRVRFCVRPLHVVDVTPMSGDSVRFCVRAPCARSTRPASGGHAIPCAANITLRIFE